VGTHANTGLPLDPSLPKAAGCLVIGRGGHIDLGQPKANEPLDANAWTQAESACRTANAVFVLGELTSECEALVDLADWQGAIIRRAIDTSVDYSNPLMESS
jgi:hypothetical protein